MAHLVIVASGKATRLKPVHQNLYPKLLINYGQKLLVEMIIESYDPKLLESITIIVPNEKCKQQITEAYIHVKNPIHEINFVIYPEATGTGRTIFDCLINNTIPTKNVFIQWSDIFATDIPAKWYCEHELGNTIFVDQNKVHRLDFKWDKQLIDETEGTGNIPGIFHFRDLQEVFSQYYVDVDSMPDNADITSILQYVLDKKRMYFNYTFVRIKDTGDCDKYESCLGELNIETRYFNEIEILSDSIIKSSRTEYGLEVLDNERAFYQFIEDIDPNRKKLNMPELLTSGRNILEIGKVEGETVHQYLKSMPGMDHNVTKKILYSQFKKDIQGFHDIGMPNCYLPEVIRSIEHEYFNVTYTRLGKMSSILPKISYVNGILVPQQQTIMSSIFDKCKDFIAFTDEFRLIHGDPNTSNVMINNKSQFVFIDPRGRFGHTKFYGDPRYDHAKFLYGLTGYDEFNLNKDIRFIYDEKTQCISIPMVEQIEKQLDYLTDDMDLKFLVGLIWLKLPYYTINNLNKSIIAYAIGLRLITKYYK